MLTLMDVCPVSTVAPSQELLIATEQLQWYVDDIVGGGIFQAGKSRYLVKRAKVRKLASLSFSMHVKSSARSGCWNRKVRRPVQSPPKLIVLLVGLLRQRHRVRQISTKFTIPELSLWYCSSYCAPSRVVCMNSSSTSTDGSFNTLSHIMIGVCYVWMALTYFVLQTHPSSSNTVESSFPVPREDRH